MAIQAKFSLSQDFVDNGCGGFNPLVYFNLQQQQEDQSGWFDGINVPVSLKNTNITINHQQQSMESYLSNMTIHDLKYKQEIEHCICLQNERLRMLMAEHSKQNLAILLKTMESKALPLLNQREEALTKATKKRIELENFLNKLETERQIWQRLAQEHEAMAVSLNYTIEQKLREKQASCSLNIEGAESCCDVKSNMGLCFCCESRSSCVLFLPCRHLCSCKDCKLFLENCPVCGSPKKATIEALMV